MTKSRVYSTSGDDNYYIEVEEGDEHVITLTVHDEDGEKWIELTGPDARAVATILCHEAEMNA